MVERSLVIPSLSGQQRPRALQLEGMGSSPALQIRSRLPADDEFIYELGRAAFGEYGKDPGRSTYAMATRGVTLVAERSARPVGFVVIEPPNNGVAYLSAIAVVEQARGRGVGRALLRAAEKLCASRGARRIELMTADSNLAALDLFLRSGFRRSARNPQKYARGQRALLLEKRL